MKTNGKIMIALATVLALGTAALVVRAQENNGSSGGDTPNGPHMRGHRPPVPAIVRALDANHDGVIDADEIANASAALKTLDKNGDGKLTPDEFMGPRPQHRAPEGGNHSANGQNPPEDTPPGPPEQE